MLKEGAGGRTVCSEASERERKGGRKGNRKGRDLEDALTAYRCWSLRKWSVALSGHMKMVSVRGELTVAYNLMFSFMDSFSMGNATARNSRAKLGFLLSLFSGLIALQEPASLLLPRNSPPLYSLFHGCEACAAAAG